MLETRASRLTPVEMQEPKSQVTELHYLTPMIIKVKIPNIPQIPDLKVAIYLASYLSSLTYKRPNRAYTWYAYLMPGSAQKFGHLISLVNAKFFCIKVKLSLVELGHIRQYPGDDLDAYVKRSHDKALKCWD